MKVTIYVRAILRDKQDCLAMFDSNRKGDINNLETEVKSESLIVWELDSNSGIKSFTQIWPRDKESEILTTLTPSKESEGQRIEFQLPVIKKEKIEAYYIECILDNGETLTLDPYIRMIPPKF